MYRAIEFRVKGVSPLVLHNGRLADPLNDYVKAMKVITGKRKKTDDDHAEIAKLEWRGSFYEDEKGRPVMPGEVIEATLVNSAKKVKNGPNTKAGLLCDGNWPIEYEGPSKIDKLYGDDRFRDCRPAKVGTARIMRTRPMFREWKLCFAVHYLPDLLNEREVVEMVERAGRIVGFCDMRPKFGRFEVESWKALAEAEAA